MAAEFGLHEAIEHFTLDDAETALLRNKSGHTRIGFAAMLKYLQWKGRFPRYRAEIPEAAAAHLGKQVKVEPGELARYDFAGRSAENHRSQVREHTGFHPCTVGEYEKLAGWLTANIAQEERRVEPIRALLLEHCHRDLIEPPTPDRVSAIIDSGIRQADALLIDRVTARLGAEPRAAILALAGGAGDEERDEPSEPDPGTAPAEDIDLLSLIKSSPGSVSLATVHLEIDKLEAVRAVHLPGGLFAGISPKVVAAWRARAAVASPSHLRRHDEPIRLALLAALVYQRQREITDTLVGLLDSTIHKINARAEKKVNDAFAKQYKAVRNKEALLLQVAEQAKAHPAGTVKPVIYPALGGEEGIDDIIAEAKARAAAFARDKRTVFASSYSHHYREGLVRLVRALEFRSSNTAHRPVLDGLGLLLRFADAKKTIYYPPGLHVALDGVVRSAWREFALATDSRGRQRVVRQVYECCVLQALRERIRCKEIWVVGADIWRNPDEDLPGDFEERREENYRKLGLPPEATAFTDELKGEMKRALGALNRQLPKLAWLKIAERNPGGAIILTPIEPLPEPRNLRRLKKAITARWGTVPLIEILKEAMLRTGALAGMSGVGVRSSIPDEQLIERLLLIAYGYGTNSGLRTVAAGDHRHSEEDLRYTARRYFTLDAVKAASVTVANATFAARRRSIWGEGSTTVASDSSHFSAFDRNVFTQWHSRYGGRGVLVYWHIEKGRMAIHSQLITCTASEVAAAIEGMMRHGTAMKAAGNYVDSHGQSEIGFGLTRLLGYQLLPRIKRINQVKLYRPGPAAEHSYPRLDPAMTRPIRWDVIEQNYDMLVKYATAIRVGTASTEAILRRFTRNASHPVYQAMLEVGRAQKTIFVARYLRDRALQHEIESGLNVVEGWNGVNDILFFGKSGELTSNRVDQQRLAVAALHLLQAALIYVNTLMIQDVLSEPGWRDALTPEDKRGLNPLFTSHMTPYGEVRLRMDNRLALTDPPTQAEPATA